MMMQTQAERDPIKLISYDRSFNGGSKLGFRKGTASLKMRPVIVNDLSMFASPKSNRVPSKQKKRIKKKSAFDSSVTHVQSYRSITRGGARNCRNMDSQTRLIS